MKINSKANMESGKKVKIIYLIYLGLLLMFWFFSSFTLFDSYTFSAIYPFVEGGILDIVELLIYGGGPYAIYKIIKWWKSKS